MLIRYDESDAVFANPERGFYRHPSDDSTQSPYLFNEQELINFREDNHETLVAYINYLDNAGLRSGEPIGKTQLDRIVQNLGTIRNAGLKCILRFAYNKDANPDLNRDGHPDPPYHDAPLPVIEQHAAQLKNVIRENSDIIAVMQSGFIGLWGEGYYSDHAFDDAARKRVITALLETLPNERMVQIRYPRRRINAYGPTLLTPETAFNESDLARLGFHNDAFLNGPDAFQDDMGTFVDESDKIYTAHESRFVMMGGETNDPEGETPDRSETRARAKLSRFHFSYFNRDYYLPTLASWSSEFLSEMSKRLGYRFVLVEGEYTQKCSPGGILSVRISMRNDGWATLYNPRSVEIRLRPVAGKELHAAIPYDIRFLQPNNTATLQFTIGIPENVATGDYELLFGILDPATQLRGRPEYAIRTANRGLWESDSGLNRLEHIVRVEGELKPCPFTPDAVLRPTGE